VRRDGRCRGERRKEENRLQTRFASSVARPV
jgi:hypothetical protein